MPDVASHEQRETLIIDVEYPEHVQRTESPEFARNKTQLVRKLDTPCFCCKSRDAREVHHFVIEWAEWDDADPEKVLDRMHHFDIYGFAAQLGDAPVASPDDIRNLMVICARCHRGAGTGIHRVPFPDWISQVVAKDGDIILKSTGGTLSANTDDLPTVEDSSVMPDCDKLAEQIAAETDPIRKAKLEKQYAAECLPPVAQTDSGDNSPEPPRP